MSSDDPQVAAVMAPVVLFMDYDDTPLAAIAAPHHLHCPAATTDLRRQRIDWMVAA
jgi:hypothetical protein